MNQIKEEPINEEKKFDNLNNRSHIEFNLGNTIVIDGSHLSYAKKFIELNINTLITDQQGMLSYYKSTFQILNDRIFGGVMFQNTSLFMPQNKDISDIKQTRLNKLSFSSYDFPKISAIESISFSNILNKNKDKINSQIKEEIKVQNLHSNNNESLILYPSLKQIFQKALEFEDLLSVLFSEIELYLIEVVKNECQQILIQLQNNEIMLDPLIKKMEQVLLMHKKQKSQIGDQIISIINNLSNYLCICNKNRQKITNLELSKLIQVEMEELIFVITQIIGLTNYYKKNVQGKEHNMEQILIIVNKQIQDSLQIVEKEMDKYSIVNNLERNLGSLNIFCVDNIKQEKVIETVEIISISTSHGNTNSKIDKLSKKDTICMISLETINNKSDETKIDSEEKNEDENDSLFLNNIKKEEVNKEDEISTLKTKEGDSYSFTSFHLNEFSEILHSPSISNQKFSRAKIIKNISNEGPIQMNEKSKYSDNNGTISHEEIPLEENKIENITSENNTNLLLDRIPQGEIDILNTLKENYTENIGKSSILNSFNSQYNDIKYMKLFMDDLCILINQNYEKSNYNNINVKNIFQTLNRNPLYILGNVQNETPEYFKNVLENENSISVINPDIISKIEKLYIKEEDKAYVNRKKAYLKCLLDSFNEAYNILTPSIINCQPLFSINQNKKQSKQCYKDNDFKSFFNSIKQKVLEWGSLKLNKPPRIAQIRRNKRGIIKNKNSIEGSKNYKVDLSIKQEVNFN